MITLQNLSIGYRSKHQLRTVASAINASLQSGSLTCLIGANGIGKSTLLRTLAGFQPPLEGEILINKRDILSPKASSGSSKGKNIEETIEKATEKTIEKNAEETIEKNAEETIGKNLSKFSAQERAKEIGVVLTSRIDTPQLTVEEIVGIGRSPYTGFWGTLSSADKHIVADALQQVGISHLSHRNIQELSDGERQKAMIAKALAQQTSIIILDEPTAFLDFPSKVETLQMLRRLAHDEHKAILLSTHDVELALQLSDHLWLMEPQQLSIGTPRVLADNGSLSRFIERDGIRFNKESLRIEIW